MNVKLYSQNINQKSWKSNDFDSICLNLDFTSGITINESMSNDIYVSYKQEGEFKENVILRTNINNRELNLEEIVSPTLRLFNDKLSVHKTVANTIEVSIPINFRIMINARSCNLKMMSSFSNIDIKIDEGRINLNYKKIKGVIKSISADIFCVNPSSKILVISKAGNLSRLPNSYVIPNLVIETIRGNVYKNCFIN